MPAADTYVPIDVAAAALKVSIRTAYRLADLHHWRHTSSRPRHYRLTDIRTTARTRKDHR